MNGALEPKLEKVDASYYNRLSCNNGDGTFTGVTLPAGVQGEGFATGVATGDYDNDGRLDLFVVNYVIWNPDKEPVCGDSLRTCRTYCHPKYYQGLPNNLYHNNGDGIFTDVSATSGIAAHTGKGMSVNFVDYDQDGRLDVFVSNDTTPNFLFHNEGGGRFREVALRAGVAFNEDGREDLFIACGDVHDNTELFSSRKSRQHNLVLVNQGDRKFLDGSPQAGASFQQTGRNCSATPHRPRITGWRRG